MYSVVHNMCCNSDYALYTSSNNYNTGTKQRIDDRTTDKKQINYDIDKLPESTLFGMLSYGYTVVVYGYTTARD